MGARHVAIAFRIITLGALLALIVPASIGRAGAYPYRQAASTPTPTVTATPTSILTPTATPTQLPSATLTPTPLPPATPTPTPTPLPMATPLLETTAQTRPPAGVPRGNLDSLLSQLVERHEEGVATAQSLTAQTPLLYEAGAIAVTFYVAGDTGPVVSFLRDNGGDVRNVGADYVEAYVPISVLVAASEQPGVGRVEAIIPPQPAYGNVVSEGVAQHRADVWHEDGYRGTGVKVGVIDAGFEDLSSLIGIELPSSIQGRCYTTIGNYSSDLAQCERRNRHGLAVAEAVMDIAPGASLYIANPFSKGDLSATVDWMIAQGVQVINYSMHWGWDGPGDGTSPYSNSPLKSVDKAVAGGALWSNSAGNAAQEMWYGPFSDPDSDSVLNFSDDDERNQIALVTGDVFWVVMRWDDTWLGASNDLNIAIYDPDGNYVAGSNNYQTGGSAHIPIEETWFWATKSGNYYFQVRHV